LSSSPFNSARTEDTAWDKVDNGGMERSWSTHTHTFPFTNILMENTDRSSSDDHISQSPSIPKHTFQKLDPRFTIVLIHLAIPVSSSTQRPLRIDCFVASGLWGRTGGASTIFLFFDDGGGSNAVVVK
jgi:hypothetical protein